MPIKKSTGEYYSWKEFFKQWAKGMKEITPEQQASSNQIGYSIMTIGIFWGMVISWRNELYWLVAILVGTLIIQLNGFYNNWQRVRFFKKMRKENGI